MKTQYCLRHLGVAAPAVLVGLLLALTPLTSRAAPGDVDLSFDIGSVITNGGVWSVAAQSDGKILIVGGFNATINDIARPGVLRVNPDGSADSSFLATGTCSSSGDGDVAVQQDGKILIGGRSWLINGEERHGIARLNTNGSLDTSFSCAAGEVNCIALQSDRKIIIAGQFSEVNGVPRNSLARLNEDGSLDTSFLNSLNSNPGPPLLWALALQNGGKILIGGRYLDSVSGIAVTNLARLNPNGSLDGSFRTGLGGEALVFSIALQPDGKILIGGRFDSVNGSARFCLARLNPNGSLDESFPGQAGWVHCFALQPDGKIFVGGWFSMINGVPRMNLARLNPDGSVDTSFLRDRAGPSAPVDSIAAQLDGKIVIGGEFSSVNQIPRHGVARLLAAYAPPRIENCQSVGGLMGFNLCGDEGQRVLVQASPNLQHWTTLATHYLGPLPVPFTDWQSTLFPQRFYRLKGE